MTNLLQSGTAWLGARLQESAGRELIYWQGASQIGPLVGTLAKHEYEVVENDSSVTLVAAYDWTLVAADLVLAGQPLRPRAGDRLKETLGGQVAEYEVLPIGKLPCCEWLDTSGILLLVHTKKVA